MLLEKLNVRQVLLWEITSLSIPGSRKHRDPKMSTLFVAIILLPHTSYKKTVFLKKQKSLAYL